MKVAPVEVAFVQKNFHELPSKPLWKKFERRFHASCRRNAGESFRGINATASMKTAFTEELGEAIVELLARKFNFYFHDNLTYSLNKMETSFIDVLLLKKNNNCFHHGSRFP